jgi:OTU domain-containing protein 5
MVVRDKCMNYISVCQDYFKDYISTDFETFEQYVNRKRRNGVWGDDVELQAMSEIYDRAIEIYAYSSQPMRTFHER